MGHHALRIGQDAMDVPQELLTPTTGVTKTVLWEDKLWPALQCFFLKRLSTGLQIQNPAIEP